jgi:hypothetical protein
MIRRFALLCLLLAAAVAFADEPKSQSHTIYKLQFVLKQFDHGKIISTHNFEVSADAADGRSSQIRTGNRIPVATGDDKYQYVDVGFNCDAQVVSDADGEIRLNTGWELSTMPAAAGPEHLIRQQRIHSVPRIILGKSITVGSIDDIDSSQQFELDVTVTKE